MRIETMKAWMAGLAYNVEIEAEQFYQAIYFYKTVN